MTEQKTRPAGATWHGFIPNTDPRYSSGWNFLAGKNLNPTPAKDDAQEIAQSEGPTAKDQEKPAS